MELLYIWVGEYKNIKNQEFNFHPKHRFHYNQATKTLSRQENPNAIDNFFGGNVSNVTAIVGENGAGKTTLLEILSRVPILKEQKSLFGNDISIFYEKGEYFVYKNEETVITEYKNFDKSTNSANFNYKAIYHSSLYTRQTHNIESGQNVIDISTDKYTSSQVKTDTHYNIRFRVNDVLKQANFIKDNTVFFENISFIQIPKYLKLSFEWFGTNHGKINHEIGKQGDNKEKTELDKFRDNNNNNILYYAYVIKRCFEDYNNNNARNLIIEKLEYYSNLLEEKTLEDEIKFKELTKIWTNDPNIYEGSKNKSEISYYLKSDEIKQYMGYLDILLSEKHTDISLCNENWVHNKGKKASKLSTGEFFFLELFSRIYAYASSDKFKQGNPNLIFLLDEVDLGYHPAWQRRILSILVNSLPEICKGHKIQIFVTSHSPFIVSDLPNENIIFLAKDKESGNCVVKDSLNDMKRTFGANIHTLLSDSFFMESLMGDFAKSKIDGVIKFLNNHKDSKMDREDAQKIINIIGEPVMKHILQKQLDNMPFDENKEIEVLKKRILELEEKLNGEVK